MKTSARKIRSIMLNKINRALRKDQPIAVTFIRKQSVLRPCGTTEILRHRKVTHLNDIFIENCRRTANHRRKWI